MLEKSRALEEYLVTVSMSGDKNALSQLVLLVGPRLVVHANRLLGDHEEAQEAVQEAWIDIYKGLRRLKSPRAFRSWALRIVTRRCAKLITGKQRQRNLVHKLSQEPLPENEPTTVLMSDENAKVRDAISKLSPEQSATVALFYLEDMRISEVAVALDVPIGTVKTRLMHARTKLKEELKGKADD
ncbi:RNA polymerase sigma factor [Amylibacter sp. SFDW26]|uniref:RNA polymerase sigma factor n=1 Tax=Amylibacter sp. SFDW26 TaxID=2652722 RepID=UPI00126255B1|nr:RNA polymerase sigma factor [Amylibacter sp. SFDW26]KAB7614507.1 RNA polymerase sigma factor [Amylibacter sp. SFDW26]